MNALLNKVVVGEASVGFGRAGTRTAARSSPAYTKNAHVQGPRAGNVASLGSQKMRMSTIRAAIAEAKDFVAQPDLSTPTPGFDSIASALKALARGEHIVVLDDEDRENEGDLIIPADRVTAKSMAFMINETSGLVCVGMAGEDIDRLALPQMVSSRENEESMYTAFTVSVDLREGTHTGISAADRALTLRALADPKAKPGDFRRPGHIFPLRARPLGVLVRPGHTEAAVDLSRLAGCAPAGVLCELVNRDDGSMQRTPQLKEFAKKHGLKCITIADLIRYRLKHESLVKRGARAALPTRRGSFDAVAYTASLEKREHVALVMGDVRGKSDVLVRVHTEDLLSDTFGQATGGHGQLEAAMDQIAREGTGVLVYLRGGATGALSRGAAGVASTSAGPEADIIAGAEGRTAGPPFHAPHVAAMHILRDLGVRSARILTDSPWEYRSLTGYDVAVTGRVGLSAAVADGAAPAPHAAQANNGHANNGRGPYKASVSV